MTARLTLDPRNPIGFAAALSMLAVGCTSESASSAPTPEPSLLFLNSIDTRISSRGDSPELVKKLLSLRSPDIARKVPLEVLRLQVQEILARSGRKCVVVVTTDEPGATVRFEPIGGGKAVSSSKQTNEISEQLNIGFYDVWTERAGKGRTSDKTRHDLLDKRIAIKIDENNG